MIHPSIRDLFASAGRHRDALSVLATARAIDPSNAMLIVETGTIHVMAGDRARARQAFENALALNPGVARAHSSLAVMAAEDGRVDEAIARWKQAVNLDPKELTNLMAFGELLWSHGREREARPELELFLASAPPAQYGRDIARIRQQLGLTP